MATSTRSATADRRRREQELRHALAAGELNLCFASSLALKTGAVHGAEAMIRWPHRRRGTMPATELMPLAMGAGLVRKVGAWTLQEACRAAARWEAPIVLGVDIVAGHLDEDGLLELIAAALSAADLLPERLEIELSERSLAACLDEHMLRLAALRDLGVGVALDEFGAGAASLTLLKRMPLTTLKLDGSMLRDLAGNREDRAILQATIRAARALGLVTVALGVETETQRSILAGMDCDVGQGPLFGPPFSTAPAGRSLPS